MGGDCLKRGGFRLSSDLMGERAIGSGAAVLDLSFSGLATTRNHQYQRRNIDLCGYHRPNNFDILVPEMGRF